MLPHLGLIDERVDVVVELALVELHLAQTVNGEQELALVCAHTRRIDAVHELRVLVDEPRLAQHIRRRVFQLFTTKKTQTYIYIETS